MEAAPVSENAQKLSTRAGLRTLLDGRRPLLGAVFLGGYAWSTFAPGSFGTALFLGTGAVLFAISVPWSSSFHRTFALASFAALAAAVLPGRVVAGGVLAGGATSTGRAGRVP